MNIRTCFALLVIAVLLAARPSSAQTTATMKTVWKKKVARVIDMRMPADTKPHALKNAGDDSTLLQMFVSAIMAHKLTAYTDPEFSIASVIPTKLFNHIMGFEGDTITVMDPTDGHEYIHVVRHDFDYDSATKLRVLEEWTFNTITGKTEIEILGIAPIHNVYSAENGELRGVSALFWFRYPDLQNIIARYEQYHPENTIAARIWDNYFLSDTKPAKIK